MCTISWFYTDQGYHVFFNRDEQKARPEALVPDIIQVDKVNALMPIDPQGGGTWCVVNEYGLTFALLNFYQGRFPKGPLQSRGKIVKHCAGLRSLDEFYPFIESLNLSKYPPFSLLFFSPHRCGSDENGVRWTGKKLERLTQASPLFSSAIRYDEVTASRHEVYRNMVGGIAPEAQEEAFIALHRSHVPTRSALSICMHREEAETVSFSHISVEGERAKFCYTNGSPCDEASTQHDASLVLNC